MNAVDLILYSGSCSTASAGPPAGRRRWARDRHCRGAVHRHHCTSVVHALRRLIVWLHSNFSRSESSQPRGRRLSGAATACSFQAPPARIAGCAPKDQPCSCGDGYRKPGDGDRTCVESMSVWEPRVRLGELVARQAAGGRRTVEGAGRRAAEGGERKRSGIWQLAAWKVNRSYASQFNHCGRGAPSACSRWRCADGAVPSGVAGGATKRMDCAGGVKVILRKYFEIPSSQIQAEASLLRGICESGCTLTAQLPLQQPNGRRALRHLRLVFRTWLIAATMNSRAIAPPRTETRDSAQQGAR